jgi:hypothetical protein
MRRARATFSPQGLSETETDDKDSFSARWHSGGLGDDRYASASNEFAVGTVFPTLELLEAALDRHRRVVSVKCVLHRWALRWV